MKFNKKASSSFLGWFKLSLMLGVIMGVYFCFLWINNWLKKKGIDLF